jgi:topoisomerase-4 subunit A
MKKYDIFDAANWLLDETYSIYEDAKKEAEETDEVEDTTEDTDDSDYTDEDDTEVDNSDLAEPIADDDEDEDEDDGTLVDLDADEDEEGDEEEVDPEDQDIYSRLDVIEDKIDALSNKTPKADDDETFDLDLSNPVCPCCGARLNIIDAVPDTEDFDAKDSDEDADIDGISDLLDGEGPEEEPETEGEDITAMDDELDNVEDIGYGAGNDYVSLDDIKDDEDEED